MAYYGKNGGGGGKFVFKIVMDCTQGPVIKNLDMIASLGRIAASILSAFYK